MHWLGYNDTVSSLNEAKTRIFQPTANFENFEIHLYLVSQPACQPAFCLLRHVKPDLHVMFFVCTLLHLELRDYSLGQVVFAVFQALLAITQLLCHVSALLTSACNVNKRL